MKTAYISYEPIPECKGWRQWVARDKRGNQIAEANDFDDVCSMAADAGYRNAVHIPNKPQLIAQVN